MVSSAFWEDLRKVHGGECHEPRASDQFRQDLAAAFAAEFGASDEAMVALLEERWPALTSAAFAEQHHYDDLMTRLGAEGLRRDPAALEADLLGFLGRARDEVVHTRALGALIDPRRAGAFGVRLLTAMLRAADPRFAEAFSDDALSKAIVRVEQQQRVRRKIIIPDLVVELSEAETTFIVVIENKVGIKDRVGQLDSYREWACGEVTTRPLFVYLTPDGERPIALRDPHEKHWVPLSYATLAEAWRRELRDVDGAWADILRLYLATVMQRVLHRRLPAFSKEQRLLVIPYLRAALGVDGGEEP